MHRNWIFWPDVFVNQNCLNGIDMHRKHKISWPVGANWNDCKIKRPLFFTNSLKQLLIVTCIPCKPWFKISNLNRPWAPQTFICIPWSPPWPVYIWSECNCHNFWKIFRFTPIKFNYFSECNWAISSSNSFDWVTSPSAQSNTLSFRALNFVFNSPFTRTLL